MKNPEQKRESPINWKKSPQRIAFILILDGGDVHPSWNQCIVDRWHSCFCEHLMYAPALCSLHFRHRVKQGIWTHFPNWIGVIFPHCEFHELGKNNLVVFALLNTMGCTVLCHLHFCSEAAHGIKWWCLGNNAWSNISQSYFKTLFNVTRCF